MNGLLSTLAGIIIAVMVALNGQLTTACGAYCASVVIHLTGLIAVLCAAWFGRGAASRGKFPRARAPLFLYLGGALGVATTVFNNIAFGQIRISAIVALSLLGQGLTSLVIDQFGLFGMQRRPLQPRKLIGLAVVAAGIACLLHPIRWDAVPAMVLSLLTGATIVVSRTINAVLAVRRGTLHSTLYNYVVGLGFSLLLIPLLGRGEPLLAGLALPANPLIYMGGLLGVATVVLSNYVVTRMSALYMTLFLFIGQVGAGVVLDALIERSFSLQNLLSGVLVAAGLCLNLLLERKKRSA